ncbi:Ribosomal protein S6 kinase beta-2 [Irineochytrium annulatum]|nr:Ribosomal protein S6 kinase beta-2 [Irineochytrium annulatum]
MSEAIFTVEEEDSAIGDLRSLETGAADEPTPSVNSLRLNDEEDDPTILVNVRDYEDPESDSQSQSRGRVGLNDFNLIRVIGKGAYGKVFLVKKKVALPQSVFSDAVLKSTGKLYAMKVLRKASISIHTKLAEHTRNERNVLIRLPERIQHQFIVKLYYAFQTPAKLYLILEYASGGELFTHLANERMFSEDVAAFYIGELLLALEHLHSIGIIYRDLKPENVLLDKDGHVMLTDFGLSKVALGTNTICGTIEFAAPEVLEEKISYGCAVDYWSLGVMLYDMLIGSPPFTGHNRKKVMEAILKKKLSYPNYISPFAKDILTKLLKKNPAQRLGSGAGGINDIKKHNFFRKLDWESLADRSCVPPIIPQVGSPDDTSNFDAIFTAMPLDSPPSSILKPTPSFLPKSNGSGKAEKAAGQRFRESDTSLTMATAGDDDLDNHFKGFSFVATDSYF